MFREFSVLQAVEFKRLEADVIARRFISPNSFTCVPETLFMTATRSVDAERRALRPWADSANLKSSRPRRRRIREAVNKRIFL